MQRWVIYYSENNATDNQGDDVIVNKEQTAINKNTLYDESASVTNDSVVSGRNKTKMLKIILILFILSVTAWTAEVSSSYALLEKHSAFNPDLKTQSVDKLNETKESLETERHPVYNPEDSRPKIKPIKTTEPIVKHERMLSDQSIEAKTEIEKIDSLANPTHDPAEAFNFKVAYRDIPYGPGYSHNEFSQSNSYNNHEDSSSPYYEESRIAPASSVWNQMPAARMIGSLVSNCISWMLGSVFSLLLGTLLTIGLCTYTNICTITIKGVGPIHEEMRSIVSPTRLEKIGHAADFVKKAIDKYQQVQTLDNVQAVRRRRAIFFS